MHLHCNKANLVVLPVLQQISISKHYFLSSDRDDNFTLSGGFVFCGKMEQLLGTSLLKISPLIVEFTIISLSRQVS
jgi:hypothetical protein